MNNKMFIIAEIGVNHDGDINCAIELIDSAKNAGADAVKFQTFNPSMLSRQGLQLAKYQKINSPKETNQNDMLDRLKLSEKDFISLKAYCDSIGISFMSTAFDSESLKFISNTLNLDILKISSGDITNAPLLVNHGLSRKKIILSSGASSMKEIITALRIIKFSFKQKNSNFNPKDLYYAVENDNDDFSCINEFVSILHCTSEYPAPPEDLNLSAINEIATKTGLTVGLSDHSDSIYPAVAAYALGARILEKHITLDRSLKGPDHAASLEPHVFKKMVDGVREIEIAYGDGKKHAQESELDNRKIIRRSICAKKNISKGEMLTESNLITLRPADGMEPINFWKIINKKSSRNYVKGDLIDE